VEQGLPAWAAVELVWRGSKVTAPMAREQSKKQNKHSCFNDMINKAGYLRRGMAGIEPTPSES
jgi:hypothetical protein